LAVAGSLTYHTVWSQSGRSSTRVMPIAARQFVCPARGPGTVGGFAIVRSSDAAMLLFIVLALYDASCSVGLLYNTYTAPISFATAARHPVLWSPSLPRSLLTSLFFTHTCTESQRKAIEAEEEESLTRTNSLRDEFQVTFTNWVSDARKFQWMEDKVCVCVCVCVCVMIYFKCVRLPI